MLISIIGIKGIIMFNFLPFTLEDLLISAGIIILFLIAGKLVTYIAKKYLSKWAEKSKTKIDDILIEKIKPPFSYIIWFLGIKIALNPLNLDYLILDKILNTVIIIIIMYIIAVFADTVVKGVLEKLAAKSKSTMDDALLPLISKSISVVIILIGITWILSLWQVDIRPLLGGLGIAGLALGFAVKDSLANVFGGISLILDQTIKIGDKVKLESGQTGNIIDMGLRSTKLRTFDNEIITIPNGQLANSRIQNYGQPDPAIRVVINFGVAYDSEVDKVRMVVLETLKTIKDIQEDPPSEVIFLSMEDFYLKFSARFWVPDYNMQWSKKLEATDKIFRALKENNINIPFPTQTIYLKN